MNRQLWLFLVLIGFLLAPVFTIAFGKTTPKTEMACCTKKDSRKGIKDCCEKSESQKKQEKKDCDGNCGHPSCQCPSIHFTNAVTFQDRIHHPKISHHPLLLRLSETSVSSGFTSLWLRPKIG